LRKNIPMGFLDFLFEDNHRRPPRKKKTAPNGKTVVAKDTLTTIRPEEKTMQKLHTSVLTSAADDIRLQHFKAKTNPTEEKKQIPAANISPVTQPQTAAGNNSTPSTMQYERGTHIQDAEWVIQRKKILEATSHDLIDSVKPKLGDGYAGLFAFDMESEAFITDGINPAPLFAVNMKAAMRELEENQLGLPMSSLIKTEEHLIYSFTRNRFVFSIFANRNQVSEGIIFHILQPLNQD